MVQCKSICCPMLETINTKPPHAWKGDTIYSVTIIFLPNCRAKWLPLLKVWMPLCWMIGENIHSFISLTGGKTRVYKVCLGSWGYDDYPQDLS